MKTEVSGQEMKQLEKIRENAEMLGEAGLRLVKLGVFLMYVAHDRGNKKATNWLEDFKRRYSR